MQTQQQQPTKNAKGGGGRKPGSLSKSTILKRAVRLLQEAVVDETIPKETRIQAALRLTEVQQ